VNGWGKPLLELKMLGKVVESGGKWWKVVESGGKWWKVVESGVN